MADAHTKPHHEYHLVDPSPWPILGAIGAFMMALGGIMWMKAIVVFDVKPGSYIFGAGVILVLYVMASWWLDVIKEAEYERPPHAGRGDRPSLRHDPVHRFGGDVLRRLVLGVFRRQPVLGREDSICARRLHRRALAAEGHRSDRSLAFPAAQHAHPLDVGHDGHLGAPCLAQQRPRQPEERPHSHDPARHLVHLRSRPTNTSTRPSTSKARSMARPSSWPRASTASTSSSERFS